MDNLDLFLIDEEAERKELEKYANFTYLYDIWLKNIEEGKALCSYFNRRGHERVAVYGMGMIGKHFVEQLKNTNVKVIYTIDRGVVNVNGKQYSYREANELLGLPDVIVVTPLMEYEDIKQLLNSEYECEIVSAEEIILSV